jgi:hypothetical protein
MVATIARYADQAGRDPGDIELSLRLAPRMSELGTSRFEDLVSTYVEAGVVRLTVDLAWQSLEAGRERLGLLAESVARIRGAAA